MLQMIFQDEDLMDDEYFHQDYHDNYNDNYHNHYLYHNDKQNRKVIKNTIPFVKNETDEEWGFYVETDTSTPPKYVFPKKNNNNNQHPPHLANPSYSYYYETTQQKNVNYLPQIQEDDHDDQFILDMDLPSDHSNDKIHGYKENISKNIFSGLTICALTTVSIYFYNKIRSS